MLRRDTPHLPWVAYGLFDLGVAGGKKFLVGSGVLRVVLGNRWQPVSRCTPHTPPQQGKLNARILPLERPAHENGSRQLVENLATDHRPGACQRETFLGPSGQASEIFAQ